MELLEIDVLKLNNEVFKYYHQVCNSVTKDPDHELYGLYDDTLKTLLVIHSDDFDLSSNKEIEIATLPGERKKGYATECIKKLLELLRERPDIKQIKVCEFSPYTTKIMNKIPCQRIDNSTSLIKNPYYDSRYEILINLINKELITKEELYVLFKENKKLWRRVKKMYIAYCLRKRFKELEARSKHI